MEFKQLNNNYLKDLINKIRKIDLSKKIEEYNNNYNNNENRKKTILILMILTYLSY
jgi:hypothetical protein